MFGIFKKKTAYGELLTLKITGMHCTSCSMSIDGVLEELPGVIEASTSYARAEVKVVFDMNMISRQNILDKLKTLEYAFSEVV